MLGYKWNVETEGLGVIQAKWAGSGNRLWRTDLYWARSLHFQQSAGVSSALAVLCDLNIHSLPRSTDQAGKSKRNARMQEVFVFHLSPVFHFNYVYEREQRSKTGWRTALCTCAFGELRDSPRWTTDTGLYDEFRSLQICMTTSEFGIFKSRIKIIFYRF